MGQSESLYRKVHSNAVLQKEQEKSQIHDLTLQLKELENQQQTKAKAN